MKLFEKKGLFSFFVVVSFLLLPIASSVASVDCDKAISYFKQSNTAKNEAQEKKLLEISLNLCPDYADAHNNIGVLLENQGDLKQALFHYKKALAIKPNFPEAWYGMGDVYRKQKQFPLALEAYLNICTIDADAKKHVEELIKRDRYKISENGEVLNSESLLVIYDKKHQVTINNKLNDCGIQISHKSRSTLKGTFRNLNFASGSTILNKDSKKQLNQLAALLLNLTPSQVRIVGHTDRQRYKNKTVSQSKMLNKQLSKARAENIKQNLVELGVPEKSLITAGAGSAQLLDGRRNSKIANAKNRRVEIELLN